MTWTPTNTVGEWGYLRVVVDHGDRTFFRATDANPNPTEVLGWQDTDPYGFNNARIQFWQVSAFENPGSGELSWLDTGKRVEIHAHNNGQRVRTVFRGFIDRLEIVSGDATTPDSVVATCVGDLSGYLAMQLHQPPLGRRKVRDAAEAIRAEIGVDDGHSPFTLPKFNAGIELAVRGDRTMSRLGFVDWCLGMGIKANGDSLTLLPDWDGGSRDYKLGWRDLTSIHATVYYGAHGVKTSLSKDLVDEPNRIFGEGVSTSGERYRNAKYRRLHNDGAPAYPYTDGRSFGLGTTNADTDTASGITIMAKELSAAGALEFRDSFTDVFDDEIEDAVKEIQERAGLTEDGIVTPTVWDRIYSVGDGPQSFAGSLFWPFAHDRRTARFLRAADGTVVDINANYDPDLIRVEEFVSFGEGVPKRRARQNAKARLNRHGGWAGTITLTSDPAEMSRFDLRGGMNIAVKYLKGNAVLLLHISSVQVDWRSGTVTLAVSTQGRHFLDLATRKERNREARRDPGMHFKHMLRRSAISSDAISGWEGESGAGIITPTTLTGGQWNVIQVVAAELGVMSRLRLTVDNNPTTFYAAIFADKVNPNVLDNTLGNPSVWIDEDNREDVWSHNAAWLVEDERLMIEAWGTPDQPCGLGTKPYLNKQGERSKWPITGKHFDNGSWDFWTENNFLYLAVYPMADCTIEGRMRIQLNEGV